MRLVTCLMCVVVLASRVFLCADSRPIIDLALYEKTIYSQSGEDGIIEKIFELISTESKYYVEFGAAAGHWACNTKYLREAKGWRGLLLDGGYSDAKINLHKEFITAENINDLFLKYRVPYDLDLLSIDIDGNDFLVWKALRAEYRPRLVVMEYNSAFLPHEDKVMIYNPHHVWDRTNYFGASMLALQRLGKLKGYTLVGGNKLGVNLFFVRDDLLAAANVIFKHAGDVMKVDEVPRAACPWGFYRQDPHRRRYVTSDGAPAYEVADESLPIPDVDQGGGLGCYLEPRFCEKIPREQVNVIVEIGSRDARDAIRLSRYYKRHVFCFECAPEAINLCKNVIGINRNATLVPKAAWSSTGTIPFYPVLDPGWLGASACFKFFQAGNHAHFSQAQVEVPSIRLDEWMESVGIQGIDLICMDSQGATLPILQGLGNKIRNVKYIITEVIYRRIYDGEALYPEIKAYMLSQGFVPYFENPQCEWSDVLFVRDDLARPETKI